jgi:hypothetical protein
MAEAYLHPLALARSAVDDLQNAVQLCSERLRFRDAADGARLALSRLHDVRMARMARDFLLRMGGWGKATGPACTSMSPPPPPHPTHTHTHNHTTPHPTPTRPRRPGSSARRSLTSSRTPRSACASCAARRVLGAGVARVGGQ